uniref:Amine oxidase n=1 Tax=Acanthochromis polyacanthus TaxID=80966 RepID=A0A3Q1E982_9TELE
MWDFIFYQSGSVEAKVHATGYIASSYLVDGNLKHGHQVAENVLGNIHTHFMNFKVDLDVAGVKNMFQTKDMEYVNVSLPWMPDRFAMPLISAVTPPQEAALRHGTKTPRYLHIASNTKNRWGHNRSYRLQVYSFAGDHLPESEAEERSMSWARVEKLLESEICTQAIQAEALGRNICWVQKCWQRVNKGGSFKDLAKDLMRKAEGKRHQPCQ